ncbi:hypothetical protein EXS74_04015 [Candidatus Woesearchaeota archaeon]|nr:hypothetical protein [Candidatus Woesearchaeota archaeon]
MDITQLSEAGLRKNQAKTYLEVLKHPGQSGGKIAKNLMIDRSFTYNTLNSLVNKGLISYITKGKIRIFYATDPENLLKDIEEKRKRIEGIVEELKTIKEPSKGERSVVIYEGRQGLKAYIRDLLNAKSFETLGGGGNLSILKAIKHEYPHYLKEFTKRKIKGKLITSQKNKEIMKEIYKEAQVDIKTFEGLENNVNFTMFKDKVAIYSAEEQPFVIIIDNKNISKSLRTYFEKLWKAAKN